MAPFVCCNCVMGVKENLSREKETSQTGETLRATSLAASGDSIGEILIAGEWKSSAFLKYCQTDDLYVGAAEYRPSRRS